jgi:hypothetical protein
MAIIRGRRWSEGVKPAVDGVVIVTLFQGELQTRSADSTLQVAPGGVRYNRVTARPRLQLGKKSIAVYITTEFLGYQENDEYSEQASSLFHKAKKIIYNAVFWI